MTLPVARGIYDGVQQTSHACTGRQDTTTHQIACNDSNCLPCSLRSKSSACAYLNHGSVYLKDPLSLHHVENFVHALMPVFRYLVIRPKHRSRKSGHVWDLPVDYQHLNTAHKSEQGNTVGASVASV